MPKKRPEDDVEVVASHQAFSTVAGWLGISPDQALQDGAPEAREEDAKRPKFLGLGATYLPHHKAVGFAAAIDTKLRKRLEAGHKRLAAAHEEGTRPEGARPQQAGGQQGDSCSGSEEEEERGKAGLLGRHAHSRARVPRGSKAEREALLFGPAAGAGQQTGGIKKRKKKKKHKHEAAAGAGSGS